MSELVPAATERLEFRCWREDDLPLAQTVFGDPRVTALVGGPFDEASVRARLAFELTNQREAGYAYWPIFLHDGTFVGCCGLKPRPELGYYLVHEHWGRGYAVEAGRSVIAFARDVLGMSALIACHHPDNHGSRAVLVKLGFHYTHHELYPPTGLQHPAYELVL